MVKLKFPGRNPGFGVDSFHNTSAIQRDTKYKVLGLLTTPGTPSEAPTLLFGRSSTSLTKRTLMP